MTGSTTSPGKNLPPRKRHAWERWVSIWHIVFYVTLVLPMFLALFSNELSYPPGLVLGLSLAMGAWYAIIMIWRMPRLQGRRQLAWTLVYLFGAITLWIPLARAHPAFYLTASSFYGLMWGTLPFGLAVAGNILLTGVIIWLQSLGVNKPVTLSAELIIIWVIALGWSVLLALWMRSVMRESAERKRLIEELEAAQSSLASAERQAGILQERQRMAQEIHDTLAQDFTSIVMQLEAADQLVPEGLTAAKSHIQKARDTARLSLVQARRLVQALRPEPLEEASLPEALRRVTNRWSQETGIKAGFTLTGDPCPLHPEAEVTLLRATQEALTNIQKHAEAHAVSVTLSYMGDQVALDVQDDGRGFDPESQPTHQNGGGYGLQTMRERVEQMRGMVVLESTPGQGTTLAVQIPVDSQVESLP